MEIGIRRNVKTNSSRGDPRVEPARSFRQFPLRELHRNRSGIGAVVYGSYVPSQRRVYGERVGEREWTGL